MATEVSKLAYVSCGHEGKSWRVMPLEKVEWEEWCDPCIASGVERLRLVCVYPADFLKIPPADLTHTYYAGKSPMIQEAGNG